MTMYYEEIDSPIPSMGSLLLAANAEAIHVVGFSRGRGKRSVDAGWQHGVTPLLKEARQQLCGYLAGDRSELELPLDPIGTDFQRDVWRALREIPYAATASYGEIAKRVGRPGAARAVGAACGANPIVIAIPCHRVVGTSGALTGFGGGIEVKRALLALEQSPGVRHECVPCRPRHQQHL